MKDLFSVEGKVALVTGGTSGIGAMITEGLLAHGAKVYIVGRDVAKGEAIEKKFQEIGDCSFIAGDLSTVASLDNIVSQLSAKESKLDILVNNAGAFTMATIDEMSEEVWDMPMNLNLKAVFFLSQKMLPMLRASATAESPARIINLGSASGVNLLGMECYSYATSKAGVHHLTRSMAKHLAPDHITVNAIAPGVFPSEIGYEPPQEVADAIIASVPLKRLGELEDVAGTVVYLASRAGAFTTGVVLSVDGGMAWA